MADGTRHVFVAGGIGITLFVAMARALAAVGGDFTRFASVGDTSTTPSWSRFEGRSTR